MTDSIRPYLPYIPYFLAGLFALSLLMLLVALYNLRRQRTAVVWRARHNAGKIGGRLLFTGLSLMTITVLVSLSGAIVIVSLGYVSLFFPPQNPYGLTGVAVSALGTPNPNQEPSPTFTPLVLVVTATPEPTSRFRVTSTTIPSTDTHTPAPSVTASATPTYTPMPTLTPTATFTHTPSPTPTTDPFTRLGLPTPPSDTTIPDDVALRIIAVDETITENETPLNPRKVFDAELTRLYFFISYRNMQNGLTWSRILYRDGEPIQGNTYFWSLGDAGASYFFFGNNRGYIPGSYEVKLFLGDTEISQLAFEIIMPD